MNKLSIRIAIVVFVCGVFAFLFYGIKTPAAKTTPTARPVVVAKPVTTLPEKLEYLHAMQQPEC